MGIYSIYNEYYTVGDFLNEFLANPAIFKEFDYYVENGKIYWNYKEWY